MNIPLSCNDNQEAEDDFRKRVLLLGVGWYDSEERHEILVEVAKSDEEGSLQIRNGEVHIAAKKERLWAGVRWPGGSTGLWALGCATMQFSVLLSIQPGSFENLIK
ncbi:uncharacterized protein N7469_001437 [Penicillium citrinum]|uniref:Uncharacterized protein n=2 Tax=Penicillium TaxID=5073 RepID=A0A9W9PEG9_PENCI|nr:uncharacterized protein N7469_001437 [Penicillium citrinum]KAJ5243110.1 hypothetical protein N7469_001437 [Penicillium citrinum]KAJ5599391.1 hypothetical protein N7450_000458 [Penicillium hetheringtonii]